MTLLKVAQVGMDVHGVVHRNRQAHRLRALDLAHLTEAERQAAVQSAKDELFNIRQLCEQGSETLVSARVVGATALRLADLRLENSMISANLFPDLPDKEYVVETEKLVSKHDGVFEELSQDEQAAANQVLEASFRLPEHRFFIENVDLVNRYREAKRLSEGRGGKQAAKLGSKVMASPVGDATAFTYGCLAKLFGVAALVALFVFPPAAVLPALAAGGCWWAQTWIKGQKAKTIMHQEAKEIAQDVELTFDLARFEEIEAKYTSIEDAKERLASDEAILREFFKPMGSRLILSLN
jgi:hypothetical protein